MTHRLATDANMVNDRRQSSCMYANTWQQLVLAPWTRPTTASPTGGEVTYGLSYSLE